MIESPLIEELVSERVQEVVCHRVHKVRPSCHPRTRARADVSVPLAAPEGAGVAGLGSVLAAG